jgi:hypothetical protein
VVHARRLAGEVEHAQDGLGDMAVHARELSGAEKREGT